MSDTGELIARLDRIPVWPYKRRVLWVVGFGFFFAFFDIVTIGFALLVIEQQFGISDTLASWAVTASLLAYIVGSFVVSRIADHFGRRVALIISVVLFTGGSLLSATATDIWWLIAWRIVSGMGIGAEIAVTSTYLSELSPARLRGRFTSWAIFFGFLGFAVVPFVALAVVPNLDWGWRLLFIIGGCGGLVIGIMRRHLPLSIRWHLAHGQVDAAKRYLEEAEATATERLGGELPPPQPVEHKPLSDAHGLGELLTPTYMRRLVLFAVVWFFYYIGNYAWLTLAPTLLINQGYSLTRSISFLAVTGVGFVAGGLIAIWLSDRIERKVLSSVVILVWSVMLAVIGWMPSDAVIVVCGFVASITIGLLIPILYTYTAENFPTRVRTTGVSATDGIGHLGGAMAPLIILPVSADWHFSGAFYAMALTGILAAVILAFGVRSTGRLLDHISQ